MSEIFGKETEGVKRVKDLVCNELIEILNKISPGQFTDPLEELHDLRISIPKTIKLWRKQHPRFRLVNGYIYLIDFDRLVIPDPFPGEWFTIHEYLPEHFLSGVEESLDDYVNRINKSEKQNKLLISLLCASLYAIFILALVIISYR